MIFVMFYTSLIISSLRTWDWNNKSVIKWEENYGLHLKQDIQPRGWVLTLGPWWLTGKSQRSQAGISPLSAGAACGQGWHQQLNPFKTDAQISCPPGDLCVWAASLDSSVCRKPWVPGPAKSYTRSLFKEWLSLSFLLWQRVSITKSYWSPMSDSHCCHGRGNIRKDNIHFLGPGLKMGTPLLIMTQSAFCDTSAYNTREVGKMHSSHLLQGLWWGVWQTSLKTNLEPRAWVASTV